MSDKAPALTADEADKIVDAFAAATKLRSLALSWFREEDFPRWCAIDAQFQPNYQHWLQRSEAAFQRHQSAGIPIVKVVLDPEEFLAWSRVNGGRVDSSARALFATIKAMPPGDGQSVH